MRNDIIIFRGPSISSEEARKYSDAIFLPPAKQGDMYKAYSQYKPKAMGLIDGNFERIPSPWHKEILYLISQGVKVFGASSMGALRASELDMFGMFGIGEIYDQYSCGLIDDDDEVAILHAPAEMDYTPLSDAMVDIRATLELAENHGVLTPDLKIYLEHFYKRSFYKERKYHNGISFFKHSYPDTMQSFSEWLKENKIHQKRDDAILLLKIIQRYEVFPNNNFQFNNTVYWHNLKFTIDQQITQQLQEELV